MAYYFFLGKTMLPVPPAKMTIKIRNKNKTVSLINEGEINIIKSAGLSDASFDIMLPSSSYPFANYNTSLEDSVVDAVSRKLLGVSFSFKKPSYYLDKIEKLKTKNKPFRFIVMRMSQNYEVLFDNNLLVTLEDYSINEDAKSYGFDVVVSVRLKQYRRYATKELEITTDENGNKTATVKNTRTIEDADLPELYKIRNEQSVWEACKRASGGSLDWRSVMNLNGAANPSAVPKKGTVLHFV
jgi:hypothetical protein